LFAVAALLFSLLWLNPHLISGPVAKYSTGRMMKNEIYRYTSIKVLVLIFSKQAVEVQWLAYEVLREKGHSKRAYYSPISNMLFIVLFML